jgi:cobalt-zinc-cadmium resistance protein CzcA
MIERIVRGAAAKPFLTFLLAIAAAALGTVALLDLRRDVFPDLSAPVFNVIVQNAAMGAEDLEPAIAIPVENALAGLPGVRRIRSNSQLGVTQVTIEFEPDTDYFRARQFVAERVQQVSAQLPPGSEPPLISSLTGRLNEVIELSLIAETGKADLMQLRDLAEFELQSRLLAVPGVAAVERLGGYLRQFQVQLDPDRMIARGVSLDEVLHSVEGANVSAAGGFVTQGPMEWNVRALARVTQPEELRGTVVSMRAATPVLLGDVAEVVEAPAVRRGVAHRLDGEIVSLRIVKQFGADTVRVSEGVQVALAELRPGLPQGVSLEVAYDQATLVRSALGGVGRAVLLGAVFVVCVLLLLLGNWRAALLVTVTIPLSIAIAGLSLRHFDVGFNTMTLGGLAIAVGLLVDASIIVVENVLHRLAGANVMNAAARKQTALQAAAEVGRPIAFATAIVVAVFLPLFGMSGLEGRMYAPLAASVIACMLTALVLALTLTPLASALWLRAPRAGGDGDVGIVRAIKRVYAPTLDACMRHAVWVRIAALSLTIPAFFLATRVGSDFMPALDEGALILNTSLPGEASLEQVDLLNHHVEDVLRTFPEVSDVVRRTGRSERTEDPMAHTYSDVLVVLKPERTRNQQQLIEAMRERTERVPGVTVMFTTPLGMRIDEGLGGTPADISVRIFGPDLDKLGQLAERARGLLSKVEGLRDLRAEQIQGLPQLRVQLDRAAAARVGLTPGDVMRALRIGLVGEQLGEVWRGSRRFDLVVRLQDTFKSDPSALRRIWIDAHDGTRVPLGQLATIEETFAPGAIRREAGSRRIAVEASVQGRDLAGAAAEVRSLLSRELALEAGYFVDVGGRVESQARAAKSLRIAIAAAAVLVFVLLYLALGSFSETFVILATLPDAFVGGILALYLAGETWNVSSLVGLIGLFGIAVQNGLVLVTQTRTLVGEGRPFDDALREASIGRVRPKLITAMTAILGLMPLLVLELPGTEIERPLAIVMIGGLVSSTLFTLLALPTFYSLVHRWRERVAGTRTHTEAQAVDEGR